MISQPSAGELCISSSAPYVSASRFITTPPHAHEEKGLIISVVVIKRSAVYSRGAIHDSCFEPCFIGDKYLFVVGEAIISATTEVSTQEWGVKAPRFYPLFYAGVQQHIFAVLVTELKFACPQRL